MDHLGRQERLRADISEKRLDALVVTHLPNIRYLSGFSGSTGVLVVTPKKSAFFTDGRYAMQAGEEVKDAKIVIDLRPALVAAAEWLEKEKKNSRSRGVQTLGIEESLTVGARKKFFDALPAGFRMRIAPSLVENLRTIKDSDEIALIRAAVDLGCELFETALKTIRPGVMETAVAAEMEYEARKRGASAMSFDTIIAAGQRSALPHGRASASSIPASGFVVCDFGVILAGYCSDMTRTVHVGAVSGKEAAFYESVLEAQLAAVDAVRSGVTASKVDQAARKVLKKAGLGRYFTHSTGHGVGIEIHEAPKVAADQEVELEPGMMITIEPGAYVPGAWGVRIEDMVLVTETGCEVLTNTSKELITV
jgi:Xaa-Pro aminopeptidase